MPSDDERNNPPPPLALHRAVQQAVGQIQQLGESMSQVVDPMQQLMNEVVSLQDRLRELGVRNPVPFTADVDMGSEWGRIQNPCGEIPLPGGKSLKPKESVQIHLKMREQPTRISLLFEDDGSPNTTKSRTNAAESLSEGEHGEE